MTMNCLRSGNHGNTGSADASRSRTIPTSDRFGLDQTEVKFISLVKGIIAAPPVAPPGGNQPINPSANHTPPLQANPQCRRDGTNE